MKVGFSIAFAVLMGLLLPDEGSLSGVRANNNVFVGTLASLQSDNSWWADDSDPYDFGNPYETEDPDPYDFGNPYETEDSDPYDFGNPYETEDSDPYESDGPWWTGEPAPYETDDPWNGSTAGCSFGICDDDSFLVDCSYVTVGMLGAEGACDGPLGKSNFDNCYPVSGSGVRSGLDSQTFRCVDATGYQSDGYSLTDIAPGSDDDVVLVLCSGESAFGVTSCEDPPSGIKYYTCDMDTRVAPPFGSDKDWYICEK